VGLFDFLPTTHAVNALNRILTLGAGPGAVLYEIVMLAVLSVIYFAAGVVLFRRFHLETRRS
jgi:ABC-2 type transport system permease protein